MNMVDWKSRFESCTTEEQKRLLNWKMKQDKDEDPLTEEFIFKDQSEYYQEPAGKLMPMPKYQFNLREIQSLLGSVAESQWSFILEGLFAKYDEIYRKADSEWLEYLEKAVRTRKV